MVTFKWHKQSEDDIWNAINDWKYYVFACLMKDSKLIKFGGLLDENYDGEITPHIDPIMDDECDYDINDIGMRKNDKIQILSI